VLALAWNPAVGLPLLIVGAIVLALIWLFGEPKKSQQGKRRQEAGHGHHAAGGHRFEPTLGQDGDAKDDPLSFSAHDDFNLGDEPAASPSQGELNVDFREELERLGATLSGERQSQPSPQPAPRRKLADQAAAIVDALRSPRRLGDDEDEHPAASAIPRLDAAAPAPAPVATPAAPRMPPRSDLGRRPAQVAVERIVTLFVVAREGASFQGADLIVAAEKAGLEFGDMGIYHRLVDGKRDQGPVFSVANMLKPGSFDLGRLDSLRTPGLSFFMTLPAPLSALDAWEAMLPTAQRMAELLGGQVLDEERNALGRQRIAHIRDELRGWDRDHEGEEIHFGR